MGAVAKLHNQRVPLRAPSAEGKAKKGKKGEEEDEKCGKNIKKDESAWWNSVNEMLGTEDQKGWDGWTEVGELETGVRDEQNPV